MTSKPFPSPWSLRERILMLLWGFCWTFLCAWTPKPCNSWRILWLKTFGAHIHGIPFVHQRARIQIPWKLTLHDRCSLGDGAFAYTLGPIEIGARATIAQEAYLCTGTHDFSDPMIPLVTKPIVVGEESFVSARAFIMPGLRVGRRAIVGACSVVTHDVPDDAIVAGNPARRIGTRSPDRKSCE